MSLKSGCGPKDQSLAAKPHVLSVAQAGGTASQPTWLQLCVKTQTQDTKELCQTLLALKPALHAPALLEANPHASSLPHPSLPSAPLQMCPRLLCQH